MKENNILLTKYQWMGVALLLLLLALIFFVLHFLPEPETTPLLHSTDSLETKIMDTKKQYYDSLRAVRTAKYDSLRLARRDSLHQLYTAHRDSVREADSIWWDSVYNSTPRLIKKDTLIELNSADTSDLKKIRGIGSSMAQRIVRYRTKLGGYTHVEQLLDNGLYMDQYGHSIKSRYCLPDSILGNFEICLDSIKSISVNHASVERLQSHPYISHTLATEIYTFRRKQVKVKQLDELRQLTHMTDSLYQSLSPYLSVEP